MITQNPAFQVLVTAGNQGVAAAGIRVDQLLSGQLGVFDYNTGLSVDGSVPSKNRNVFIAVGKGAAAGQACTDIRKSAGENIEKAGLKTMSQMPYAAPVDKKVVIDFGTIAADTLYAVKIEFRSQEAFRNFGNNTPSKTATLESPSDVSTVALKNQFIIDFGKAVLLADQEEGILKVAYLDPSNNSEVTEAGLAAWQATVGNETEVLKLQISASATALKEYSNVNLNYLNARLTNVLVSLVEGFPKNATVTVLQEMVFEQTLGYDVNQLEYVAGGWNGKPGLYRESSIGFAATELLAVAATGYDLITLNYDNAGIGGGLKYGTSLQTIVAIPQADNATFTAVENLLNLVFRDIAGASVSDEMSAEVE